MWLSSCTALVAASLSALSLFLPLLASPPSDGGANACSLISFSFEASATMRHHPVSGWRSYAKSRLGASSVWTWSAGRRPTC